jgi:hypothetical protein
MAAWKPKIFDLMQGAKPKFIGSDAALKLWMFWFLPFSILEIYSEYILKILHF